MNHGFTGKILLVDLTHATVKSEELSSDIYRLYPGGKALAAYLLLNHMPQGAGPLEPENVLVLANGLLTGAPLSTATRFTAAARSPLTGAYGESEAGGYWGPELKMAGLEAIVISGKAPNPVYLWVHDGEAEIRPAEALWGRGPDVVQEAIRQELGDRLIRVLQIGLAGENRVRYAAIGHELRHFNGRTGMGAVMGSKNLKAVAVRGHRRYLDLACDRQKLADLGKTLAAQVREHPQSWDMLVKGTPGLTGGINAAGMLPTRNFQGGAFEGIEEIAWEAYEKTLYTGNGACYACGVRCKREVKFSHPELGENLSGGPEYETISGFGSDCGVSDLAAIAQANELCNRYGLDTISTSATIAFAMECYERGLIGPEQTGGLELRFGNAQAMLALVDQIAHREGFGNLLAEGSRLASRVIGGEAPKYAMHVKGEELPMHEPRGKVGVGLGYAAGETGADHLVAYHDPTFSNPDSLAFKAARPLGVTEAIPPRELSYRKAELYHRMESWSSLGKTLGFCYFGPAPRSFIQVDQVLEAVQAATGWEVTAPELLAIGEHAVNLARIFNLREGFSRGDDRLPERFFTPLQSGALAGTALSEVDFEQTLTDLYRIKGWDPATTLPSQEKLKELHIEWAGRLLSSSPGSRHL